MNTKTGAGVLSQHSLRQTFSKGISQKAYQNDMSRQFYAINILRFHSSGFTLRLEMSNLAFSGRPEELLFRFSELRDSP
ncbi:hypothetical protein, partial [Segatella oris]|uniref:hypothetical protein n=1 Tax=Segatella oris TaxID=28135 RepID=UPI0028EDAB31